jgi:hypothetical protein
VSQNPNDRIQGLLDQAMDHDIEWELDQRKGARREVTVVLVALVIGLALAATLL